MLNLFSHLFINQYYSYCLIKVQFTVGIEVDDFLSRPTLLRKTEVNWSYHKEQITGMKSPFY